MILPRALGPELDSLGNRNCSAFDLSPNSVCQLWKSDTFANGSEIPSPRIGDKGTTLRSGGNDSWLRELKITPDRLESLFYVRGKGFAVSFGGPSPELQT